MAGPLETELELMRETDRAIRAIYQRAQADINNQISRLYSKKGISKMEAESRLRIQQRLIGAINASGDYTREGVAKAVRASANMVGIEFQQILKGMGLDPTQYVENIKQSAEDSIRLLQARKTNGITLSQRVYREGVVASGKLDDVINSHLVRGASAAELRRAVKDYVNPDTPGGVRYASQRLARTEINNAFHQATKDRYNESPFVDYVEWNLSGSHPRPDKCNEFAEQVHVRGQQAGVYEAGAVPGRPHPNCLCFIVAVDLDDEEMMRRIRDGEMTVTTPPSAPKPTSSKAPAPAKPPVTKPITPAQKKAIAPLTKQVEDDWTAGSDWKKLRKKSQKTAGTEKEMKGWRDSLRNDPKERHRYEAWDGYLGEDYESMNGFLRNPTNRVSYFGGEAKLLENRIDPMDTLFKDPKYGREASEEMILTRGVSVRRGTDLDRMFKDGNTVVERGYMSTTSDPNIADTFTEDYDDEGGRPHVLNIRVPKGAKYIYGNYVENEVIFPRGTGLKIRRMIEREDGVTEVFADLIP